MSNEKVRLLLLIKEELLEYLQKQFDNDALVFLADTVGKQYDLLVFFQKDLAFLH